MGIFDRFKQMVDQKSGQLARVWSQAPKTETAKLPNLFHQTPRLDPVDLIASTIAGAPLQLFDRAKLRKDKDNVEPIENHPFYDLLDYPSKMFPELDGYAMKYMTVVLTELLGECFWVKFRDGGRVTEILVFPPSWCLMTPTRGNPTFTFQPYGTTASKTFIVEPSDVVWFKQPDLTDPFGRGRGRSEALGDELDTDEMAAKWQKNYFYNDATPPFWANLPGAKQSDLERMRDTWGQRLGGWLNARKPAFTGNENIQIAKLGDTTREMDFVESRKWLRDMALQHYQIPPEMFGIVENSNRSTIDSAYYLFAKNVITKRLGFYERVITRQLVHADFDNRLEVRFDFEIPEDEAFRLQKVSEGLKSGALTRAEWKRAMGFAVEKTDDVYIVPYSTMFVPAGEKTPPPQEEPVIDIVDAPVKTVKKAWEQHWKTADNRARQGEGMFRNRTKAFAEVQSGRVKKGITPDNWKAKVDDAFKGADDALMHAYAPAWLASMTDGAEVGRQALGLKASPSFTLYVKTFDQWIKSYGLQKAKEINQTTYDELRKKIDASLAEGIEAGESIPNLSTRILEAVDGVYDNMSGYRAEMISRTESMASVNFGQSVVYEEEGVEEKEWIATMDEDTRDAHASADGEVVKVSDDFEVGGEALAYPGDPKGSASNLCNCRCTIAPVVSLKGGKK